MVSTHSRAEAAAFNLAGGCTLGKVSTHSRAEVAASKNKIMRSITIGFNTQPPEGGCLLSAKTLRHTAGFNTQPHGGGCYQAVKCANNV